MTSEKLNLANEGLRQVDIKGKAYVEVLQRVKGFRAACPGGSIETELISNENGVCVIKATVKDEDGTVLGTGMAYEKEGSTFINKTSYIENCETSAVGRALAFCGIGIDTSIASFEEVATAMKNQEQPKQSAAVDDAKVKADVLKVLNSKGAAYMQNVCNHYRVSKPTELTADNCRDFIKEMEKRNNE